MTTDDLNEAESSNGTAACAVSRAVPCSSCGATAEPYFSRIFPMGYFCPACGKEEGTPPLRLVKLEVAVIATRQYTKVVEVPEEVANRICGMMYNDGWDERRVCSYIDETDGQITRESWEHTVDTIDVLSHPDDETNEKSPDAGATE
jgi:hypothetical protein